jgi:hypothetical protein
VAASTKDAEPERIVERRGYGLPPIIGTCGAACEEPAALAADGSPPDEDAAAGTGGDACEPPDPLPLSELVEPGTGGGGCEPADEPPPMSVEPGTGGGACEPFDEPPESLEPGTPGKA